MASGEGVCEVMVEYEYTGEQEDELTLRPGDIITEVKKMKGGWWEGSLNGKRGVFPDNFVKEIRKETFKPEKRKEPKKVLASQQKHPEPEVNHSPAKPAEAAAKPPGSGSSKKKHRARVTYSYTPVNEDELDLKVGDVVDISSMEDEGWWHGSLDGKDGMFPSNFVEIVSDTEKDEEGKEILIKGKKVKGIGLGMNIFEGGVPKLKPAKLRSQDELSPPIPGTRPPNNTKKEPPLAPKLQPQPVTAASEPKSDSVEKAKVVFPYTAENEDELTLEEGQSVIVLDKDLDDSGWWRGRVNGREGVFPDNFVELLPPEETKPKRPTQGVINKTSRQPPPEQEPKVELKDDKNKRESVTKRTGPPPPLGKKPGKNADAKLMAQTDDHKAQEQQTGLYIESADPNPKLRHPTKERPKPPMNRQPASVKSTTAQKEVQSRAAPAHSNSQPETMVAVSTASTTENTTSASSPRRPISPPLIVHKPQQQPSDVPRKTAGAVGSAEIIELRKQLEELRENYVPKKLHDELKVQLTQLKSQVEAMKKTYDKRLYDVMVEVDDEKKERIGLQIEVERVKKLVTPMEL